LPGLFEQIGERFGVDLKGTPVVGDGLRDLQAGVAAGCEPHLVLTGKGAEFRGRALPETYPAGTQVHDDLAAFADWLIARQAAVKAAA
jgi:D-glycero-D-manno-heptose 1,7-bisphosphate phosphatase